MPNRIVITKYNSKYITVFIRNDEAIKIRCTKDIYSKHGSIFLGCIKEIKKNISSSFLTYGNKNKGFIKGSDYKPEAVMPVMVRKKNTGEKLDELTRDYSINGLYVVISDKVKGVSFSKKLSAKFKDQFKDYDIKNAIIRTNAENTDLESILNEYNLLYDIYKRIEGTFEYRTNNSILYDGILDIIDIIFSENIADYDEILTDESDVYNLINDFILNYKALNINIPIKPNYYNDKMISLFSLFSLSKMVDSATERKVYLKSSAYIVFDYTEAMTVIDVNSGNTCFKGNKADIIHRINMEACEEIAKQLKLRNLSGIIVVDFINESDREYEKELKQFMDTLLYNDDCHAKCYGITKLGLMEITRDRKEIPLREQLWK